MRLVRDLAGLDKAPLTVIPSGCASEREFVALSALTRDFEHEQGRGQSAAGLVIGLERVPACRLLEPFVRRQGH